MESGRCAGCEGVVQVVRDFGALWKTAAATWREMDMLVLDEVSMLQAEMLEWLDCEVATYSLICACSLLCLLTGLFRVCLALSRTVLLQVTPHWACYMLLLPLILLLTVSHCVCLSHCISLYLTTSVPLSLYLTVSHCITLYLTVSHCITLYLTVSASRCLTHCLCLSHRISHCCCQISSSQYTSAHELAPHRCAEFESASTLRLGESNCN